LGIIRPKYLLPIQTISNECGAAEEIRGTDEKITPE
jgi:hypothetical protein